MRFSRPFHAFSRPFSVLLQFHGHSLFSRPFAQTTNDPRKYSQMVLQEVIRVRRDHTNKWAWGIALLSGCLRHTSPFRMCSHLGTQHALLVCVFAHALDCPEHATDAMPPAQRTVGASGHQNLCTRPTPCGSQRQPPINVCHSFSWRPPNGCLLGKTMPWGKRTAFFQNECHFWGDLVRKMCEAARLRPKGAISRKRQFQEACYLLLSVFFQYSGKPSLFEPAAWLSRKKKTG